MSIPSTTPHTAKRRWYIPLIAIGLMILAIWGIGHCNQPAGPPPVPIVKTDTPVIDKPTEPTNTVESPPPAPSPRDKSKDYTEAFISAKMIFVEGGTFKMGRNANTDEKPIHSVTLSGYYIGETEVTQAQWRKVMGSDPPELYHKGCDNCPVERVSWSDIQEFLIKLNQQTGKQYRLPTEAEWEYAARGGSRSKGFKYAGSNSLGDVAWYGEGKDYDKGGNSHPVKTKAPNELDIYDMSGNVWEWCQDAFDENYYQNSPSTNPVNNKNGRPRILRGGSWFLGYHDLCRVSFRYYFIPDHRYYIFGFRLARDL